MTLPSIAVQSITSTLMMTVSKELFSALMSVFPSKDRKILHGRISIVSRSDKQSRPSSVITLLLRR